MGFGGFSIGALRKLELSMARQDLMSVCKRWDTTHDVGLGIYTWMHAIPAIRLLQGGNKYPGNALNVLWHKPKQKLDEIFMSIWKIDRKEEDKNSSFDLDDFITRERLMGRRYVREIGATAFPISYSRNTLFYRKLVYNTAVGLQLQESQRPKSLVMDMTEYGPKNCTEDFALFNKWKEDYTRGNDTKSLNEPQMCLDYSMFVSSLTVPINTAEFPSSADLKRR